MFQVQVNVCLKGQKHSTRKHFNTVFKKLDFYKLKLNKKQETAKGIGHQVE